ncbi:MAG: hypothetical protein LQ340_000274 [Diploschistes diacapsis]|nr:MAG: hypothetical protein LQ340_000274 [Diploschistes diacapsis]
MEEFEEFSVVFGGDIDLAYDHKTIEKLLKNRRLLESILFFDRLLGALGIKDGVYEQRPCIQQTKRLSASQLYPPKSNEDLRILYDSITSAPAQNHHKHSLVYYILKDLKLRNRDPETFATRYYHTVSPPIHTSKVLDAYFQCVCQSSITEAFHFARSQGIQNHRRLFEQMLSFILGSSSGKQRSDRAIELIGLPFDQEEQSWFQQHLLDGKGKALFGAKDTVIMRYMALGELQAAREVSRETKERKIDNLNWTSLT